MRASSKYSALCVFLRFPHPPGFSPDLLRLSGLFSECYGKKYLFQICPHAASHVIYRRELCWECWERDVIAALRREDHFLWPFSSLMVKTEAFYCPAELCPLCFCGASPIHCQHPETSEWDKWEWMSWVWKVWDKGSGCRSNVAVSVFSMTVTLLSH